MLSSVVGVVPRIPFPSRPEPGHRRRLRSTFQKDPIHQRPLSRGVCWHGHHHNLGPPDPICYPYPLIFRASSRPPPPPALTPFILSTPLHPPASASDSPPCPSAFRKPSTPTLAQTNPLLVQTLLTLSRQNRDFPLSTFQLRGDHLRPPRRDAPRFSTHCLPTSSRLCSGGNSVHHLPALFFSQVLLPSSHVCCRAGVS